MMVEYKSLLYKKSGKFERQRLPIILHMMVQYLMLPFFQICCNLWVHQALYIRCCVDYVRAGILVLQVCLFVL